MCGANGESNGVFKQPSMTTLYLFIGFVCGLWFYAKALDQPETQIKVHKIKGNANKIDINKAEKKRKKFLGIFKRKNKHHE